MCVWGVGTPAPVEGEAQPGALPMGRGLKCCRPQRLGQAGVGWAWGWSGEEPPELGPTEGDWQPLQWWTQAWVPECQVCGRNYAPRAIAPSYFKCHTVPLAACLFFFSRPGLTQLIVSKLKLGLCFLPVSVKAPEISMGKVSCALVPLHSCVRNLTYYHSP